MPPKEFDKTSSEHSGVQKGMKFKITKPHHEVLGDLEEGSVLELENIAHYPTRYRSVSYTHLTLPTICSV